MTEQATAVAGDENTAPAGGGVPKAAPARARREGLRRALRIGIIRDGRVVLERVLKGTSRVTIGKAPRNTLAIPFAFVPPAVTMFDVRDGRPHLRFVRGMDGRVAVGDEVLRLHEVAARKLARHEGNAWYLPLDEHSRGKVVLGDVNVLYQVVAQGAAAPQLDWRKSAPPWWQRLDRPLFLALFLSLLFQGGTAGYGRYWWEMTGQFLEKEEKEQRRRERISVEVVTRKPDKEPSVDLTPPESPAEEGQGAFSDAADEAPQPEDVAADAPPPPAGAAKREEDLDPAARYQRRLEHVKSDTILKFTGGGPRGTPVLGGSVTGDDLAAAAFGGGDPNFVAMDPGSTRMFRGVPAAAMAEGDGSGGGGGGYRKLSGKGGGKYTGAIKTGKVETAQKDPEVKVKVHVSGELGAKGGVGQLDKDAVASVFRRRRSAVRRCYEESLRTNPNVQGKVTIQFTIGTAGRITTISVTADTTGDSKVADCIMRNVKSWRFDPPERGSVTFSYPFVLSRG